MVVDYNWQAGTSRNNSLNKLENEAEFGKETPDETPDLADRRLIWRIWRIWRLSDREVPGLQKN
jgi:hypothetical protein